MACHPQTRRRRAWVSLWVLLSLTVMLAALALALNAGWLTTAAQELRGAADAAGLAAAGELVSDEWLRQGSPALAGVLQNGREAAVEFARANLVLGRRLAL